MTHIHFCITVFCPCEMFLGLTAFCLESIVSNSDSVSAAVEMESKHMKEAASGAGPLLSQGSSLPDQGLRPFLPGLQIDCPGMSPTGFVPFWKLRELYHHLQTQGLTLKVGKITAWAQRKMGGYPLGYGEHECCGEMVLDFQCRRGTTAPLLSLLSPAAGIPPSAHGPSTSWPFLLILVKLSKLGEHLFSDRYLSRYSTKSQGDQPATVPGREGT